MAGCLLFGFLVRGVRTAPLAELLEFKTFLNGFFVLVAHVPDILTFGALELDHVVLRHNGNFAYLADESSFNTTLPELFCDVSSEKREARRVVAKLRRGMLNVLQTKQRETESGEPC